MTLDAGGALIVADRRLVQAVALVSVIMLAGSVLVRAFGPSPFAPRVNVRWVDGLSDARRLDLERSLALVNGEHREGTTWQYDLTDVSPSAVRALVGQPGVADTHYIDRVTGAVNPDAPIGTARLVDPGMAGMIRSPLFDWFVSFWVASLVVSAAWLAQARDDLAPQE